MTILIEMQIHKQKLYYSMLSKLYFAIKKKIHTHKLQTFILIKLMIFVKCCFTHCLTTNDSIKYD